MKTKSVKPITNENGTPRRSKPSVGQITGFEKNGKIPEATIHRWIAELKDYLFDNPHEKTITKFVYSCGYNEASYYKALKDYPELYEAHYRVLQQLGERLWGNSVEGKYNWQAAKFMLHNYGKDFLQAKELEANLKSQENQQGIVMVSVPAIPAPKE